MKEFFINIWNRWRSHIIYSLIIFCLIYSLGISIRSCSSYKEQSENSIIALTDTINYYEGKQGEIIASKTLLETDFKNLKIVNDSLYEAIKSMKVKNPDLVIQVDSKIENPQLETKWEIIHDTIVHEFTKPFNFNNEYRSLEGYVTHADDKLALNILKDEVYFDYTIAIKGTKAFLTSSNPYVKYNEITGIVVPKDKPKKFGIGPVIYGGYDLKSKSWGYGIGIGVTYSLFQF